MGKGGNKARGRAEREARDGREEEERGSRPSDRRKMKRIAKDHREEGKRKEKFTGHGAGKGSKEMESRNKRQKSIE